MTDAPITTAREAIEAAARICEDRAKRLGCRWETGDARAELEGRAAAIRALASRIPEPGEDEVERVARAIYAVEGSGLGFGDDPDELMTDGDPAWETWKVAARAALSAMRPAPAEEWRSDMQNAPGYEGLIHARGLWVHNFDGKPTEFYAAIGYVDEDGDFITGDGPAGWPAMDFEFWMPIPAFPAAPAQGGRDE